MTTDLHWFKSSYSGSEGECLEIAIAHSSPDAPALRIRDSKTPGAPALKVSPAAWSAFLPHACAYQGG